MRDVVFVLVIVGFFALAAGYVRACGWIIGPEEIAPGAPDDVETLDEVEVGSGAR